MAPGASPGNVRTALVCAGPTTGVAGDRAKFAASIDLGVDNVRPIQEGHPFTPTRDGGDRSPPNRLGPALAMGKDTYPMSLATVLDCIFSRPDASSARRVSFPLGRLAVLTGLGVSMFAATPALGQLAGGVKPAATPGATPAARKLSFTATSDTVDLLGLEQAFSRISQSVSPSVVAITASHFSAPAAADLRSSQLTPSAINHLLSAGPKIVGTGFCIDPAGYILTNEHVVSGAKQIYVTVDSGRVYPAIVIGTDPRSDLAVIKVPVPLPAVEMAQPGSLRRGQWTIAIGNPVGLAGDGEMAMSVGVVSATGRHLPKLSEREGRLYSNLIQTTAEVNPGNSGGPLFDLTGRVVGIVTAVVLPQRDTNGLGFAMPVDGAMRRKIDQLKRGDPVVHGYLGVAVRSQSAGAVKVTTVGLDTPATGKLAIGDEIVRLDGIDIEDEDDFIRTVGACPTDRAVPIVLRRGGKQMAVNVHLDPRADAAGIDRYRQRLQWQGITFAQTDGPTGEDLVTILDVDLTSPLANKFGRGLTVQGVAQKAVTSLAELHALLDHTPIDQLALDTFEPAHMTAAASSLHEPLAGD